MKKTKLQKGITLIALIITIVVLLILAIVTIGAVQESGIIAHAQNAATYYNWAKADEEGTIAEYETFIEESIGDVTIVDRIVHEGIIPEGATYTAVDGNVYNAGQAFPETVTTGDIYVFEDYEYRYNYIWCEEWLNAEEAMDSKGCADGWGVRVKDTTKKEYSKIITTINGKNIVYMVCTFMLCESLTTAPYIPSTVINLFDAFAMCKSLTYVPNIPNSVICMEETFLGCTSITTIPAIPSSVTYWLSYTFKGCISLEGEIEINANPAFYEECFKDTVKNIKIIGIASQETKAALAETATNGNVSY